jgi:hypothetical protein
LSSDKKSFWQEAGEEVAQDAAGEFITNDKFRDEILDGCSGGCSSMILLCLLPAYLFARMWA